MERNIWPKEPYYKHGVYLTFCIHCTWLMWKQLHQNQPTKKTSHGSWNSFSWSGYLSQIPQQRDTSVQVRHGLLMQLPVTEYRIKSLEGLSGFLNVLLHVLGIGSWPAGSSCCRRLWVVPVATAPLSVCLSVFVIQSDRHLSGLLYQPQVLPCQSP